MEGLIQTKPLAVTVLGQGHLGTSVSSCLREVGYKLVDFKKAKYIIIAFDTPFDKRHRVDLTLITKAVKEVKKYKGLVIIMSPMPVGTCRKLQKLLGRDLVYNPENLRIVNGRETYLYADRQVIGCSPKLAEKMREFYGWFYNPLIFMSLESAEMTKHGINTFLATSIVFANQIEKYCKKAGADYNDVLKGIKSDSRIGQKAYLTPGQPSKHLKRDLRILEKIKLLKMVYDL